MTAASMGMGIGTGIGIRTRTNAGNLMTQPDFSIIVPTFQRRDLARDCVLALDAMQTDLAFEIIVVVDGSTDGTAATISALDTRHRVIVLEQQNSGAAAARNRGAESARGSYLLFVDDDMTCAAGLLDVHHRELTSGADLVIGHVPVDPRSPPGLLADAVAAWSEDRRRRLSSGDRIGLGEILTGQMSIRRELFDSAGAFDERFTADGQYGNEDLDFGARVRNDHKIHFAADAISHQRYVITPRQNLDQAFQSGQADVTLAEKAPELTAEIFAPHWPEKARVTLLFRPIAKSPSLVRLARALARFVSGPVYGHSPRIDALMLRVYANLREIVYWAGVEERRSALRSSASS